VTKIGFGLEIFRIFLSLGTPDATAAVAPFRVHHAMHSAFAAAMARHPAATVLLPKTSAGHPVRPENAGKDAEPALLRIAEALIKRFTRVGDMLEHHAELRHFVGLTLQPCERIRRLPLTARLARLYALVVQLG